MKPWGENIFDAAKKCGPHCTQFGRFSRGVLGVEYFLRSNINTQEVIYFNKY